MRKVNSPADLPPEEIKKIFDGFGSYKDLPTIPIAPDLHNQERQKGPYRDPYEILEVTDHYVIIRTKDGRSLALTPYTMELQDLWHIAPLEDWGEKAQDLRLLLETVRSNLILEMRRQGALADYEPQPISLTIPKSVWLVKPFFPARGLVGLIGPSGSRKTYLALDLALSVATGQQFLGEFRVARPGGVLWLSPEGREEQSSRFLAWCRKRGVDPEVVMKRVYTMNKTPILPVDGWKILEAARRIPDLRLIVIDPMVEFLSGQDENNNALIASVLASIQHVVDTLGVLVLVTHHTGHKQDRGRGGSAFRGKLDREFLIKVESPDSFTLVPTKIRGYGFPPTINIAFELVETGHVTEEENEPIVAGVLSYQGTKLRDDETKSQKLGENQASIMDWITHRLEAEDSPPREEEAREYFKHVWGRDKAQKCFTRTLKALIERGLVFREEGFLYTQTYLARKARAQAQAQTQVQQQPEQQKKPTAPPSKEDGPPDEERGKEEEKNRLLAKARQIKQKMLTEGKKTLKYYPLQDPLWLGITQDEDEAQKIVGIGTREGLFKMLPGWLISLVDGTTRPPPETSPRDSIFF